MSFQYSYAAAEGAQRLPAGPMAYGSLLLYMSPDSMHSAAQIR